MVKEVTMPQLATYEIKPYFYLDDPAQGVVFVAPVNGTTTSGSSYPRSELRQMNGSENAAWSNSSATFSMEAVMCFKELPGDKPHVVGMQIHDSNDDVTVLRLEGNDLWATKGDEAHGVLMNSSYVLGTFMKVKVEARKGGGIRWYINDVLKATPVSGTISGAYFKAGCYTQANTSNGTGRGVTIFKSLRVWKS